MNHTFRHRDLPCTFLVRTMVLLAATLSPPVCAETFQGECFGKYEGLVLEAWANDPQYRDKLDQLRTQDTGMIMLTFRADGTITGTVDYPLMGVGIARKATGTVRSTGEVDIEVHPNPDDHDSYKPRPLMLLTGKATKDIVGGINVEGKIRIRSLGVIDPETNRPVSPTPTWSVGKWSGGIGPPTDGTTPQPTEGETRQAESILQRLLNRLGISGLKEAWPQIAAMAALLFGAGVGIALLRKLRKVLGSRAGQSAAGQSAPGQSAAGQSATAGKTQTVDDTTVLTGRKAHGKLRQVYGGQLITAINGRQYVPVPVNWGGGILGGGFHRRKIKVRHGNTTREIEVVDPEKPVSLVVPWKHPADDPAETLIPENLPTAALSQRLRQLGLKPQVVTTASGEHFILPPANLPQNVAGSAYQTRIVNVPDPANPGRTIAARVIDPAFPVVIHHWRPPPAVKPSTQKKPPEKKPKPSRPPKPVKPVNPPPPKPPEDDDPEPKEPDPKIPDPDDKDDRKGQRKFQIRINKLGNWEAGVVLFTTIREVEEDPDKPGVWEERAGMEYNFIGCGGGITAAPGGLLMQSDYHDIHTTRKLELIDFGGTGVVVPIAAGFDPDWICSTAVEKILKGRELYQHYKKGKKILQDTVTRILEELMWGLSGPAGLLVRHLIQKSPLPDDLKNTSLNGIKLVFLLKPPDQLRRGPIGAFANVDTGIASPDIGAALFPGIWSPGYVPDPRRLLPIPPDLGIDPDIFGPSGPLYWWKR